jgi:hypothetical protein
MHACMHEYTYICMYQQKHKNIHATERHTVAIGIYLLNTHMYTYIHMRAYICTLTRHVFHITDKQETAKDRGNI